jgi:hypothetical protein
MYSHVVSLNGYVMILERIQLEMCDKLYFNMEMVCYVIVIEDMILCNIDIGIYKFF